MKLRPFHHLLVRNHNRIRWGFFFLLVILLSLFALNEDAFTRYEALLSVVVSDRAQVPLAVKPNAKGHYALRGERVPPLLREYLLRKEDAHFYYHPGINPVSMARAIYKKITTGRSGGSSTITEQLAKNLLGTENNRTVRNKLRELFTVLALELFTTKDTILTMYANTVYLGNQVQGFETASYAYFGKKTKELTPHEISVLLATLSYPATRNPWKEENLPYAEALYTRLKGREMSTFVPPRVNDRIRMNNPVSFELDTLDVRCAESCTTTIDNTLSEYIRGALVRSIEKEYDRGVKNGAVVVIHPRTHELLALIGTPDPEKDTDGGKINMALRPRPIGSTVKPFIYAKGMMEGLRPYTIVDDREYRYPIATGYSLYPKNFDGTYHGEVTLQYALANSLNVPSVKVLEHIGLPSFYRFLEHDLGFVPIAPLDTYQYGIALGGLEMDLLTLTYYTTLFPNGGVLSPITLIRGSTTTLEIPQSRLTREKRIADTESVALVTTMLMDRLTGVEQFGLVSSLNVSLPSYAVKTGTSRDFHDSWVIGYTPDFVVGVWLGNSENTPLAQVSGQSGAGALWHDVMGYLRESPYYTGASFDTSGVILRDIEGRSEWSLASDVPEEHRNLLTDNRLILSPHDGDVFGMGTASKIPFTSRVPLTWYVKGNKIGEGRAVTYTPTAPGTYEIEGRRSDDPNAREIITITVREE